MTASSLDRGAVTAEFAVALPAAMIALALCLSGAQAASTLVRLQDAAADAARSLARGDGTSAAAAIARRQVARAALSSTDDGSFRCVSVRAPADGAMGALGLRLEASSCALGGGR